MEQEMPSRTPIPQALEKEAFSMFQRVGEDWVQQMREKVTGLARGDTEIAASRFDLC